MPLPDTIAAAHAMLRSKEISSRELVQVCINQIEKIDTTLNAVVYRNFEKALSHAGKIDAEGITDEPLCGIPYLAKDIFCEEGIPTTACSNILRSKDYKPPFDSTTTIRLKNAGAISIGKSNTDEFTMGSSTETSCYGPTRNPWDTARTAGGSSGGSAAGIAADECLFGLGTDTGGSIRLPAAYCNVVGLRPTFGRTSRYGVMSMGSSIDTIGPLTKTVEDMALVMQAIAGFDPKDATTGKRDVPDYRKALKKDVKGMRIGIPKEYFIEGMNAEMEASVRDAAKVFESLGATTMEISLPHTKYATPCYYVLCPSAVSSNQARYDGIRFGHSAEETPRDLIDQYFKVRSSGFGPEVKRRIMIGTYALSAGYYDAYYRQAQKVRTLIVKDFTDAFVDVDVIIAPVSPTPAFKLGAHEGDPIAMYLEDIFLDPQVMGGIPAMSVPGGFSRDGLPIGLQIMGPQWGEEVVLHAGYAYEQATEWHKEKPKL